MININYITETLQKLVQINSVNPGLDENGPGEVEIGTYIAERLQEMGIEPMVDELAPGRLNVTGVIKGDGTGRSLMLNAHMDTVGVKGMTEPFSGRIQDGKLYGRGSYDMKGSIAAILGVAKAICESGKSLKGDLILSFVADEEYESIGAESLVKKIRTDDCIVTEPTDLKLCTAHRGFGIWKIHTKGKTAHGGNHHLGVDANANMGLLMAELYRWSDRLQKEKIHPLCGAASMHLPLVNGGRSLFVYSHECEIHVERRTIPGESREEIEQDIKKLLNEIARDYPGFEASMELVIWRSPYEIEENCSIVKRVADSLEKVTDEIPEFIGHTWWEDSAIFGDSGIETVILGPKGGGIHEDVEWVEMESVRELAGVIWDLCLDK
tara:strand:+ start:1730 stop:2872 length:1143 start_codon:yes stop_codon:yes gene_type:complete